MKKYLALFGLLLAVSLTGCASNKLITATGTAALDAYKGRNLSRAQMILMAKRAALVDAQRNMLEEYAGTFLSTQTEIKNFVAQNDHIISKSGGFIKGVHKVSEQLTPDNTAIIVRVQARESDIDAALKRRW